MKTDHALLVALGVPWNAFVGVFLYYTALTLAAIGVGELSGLLVAVAYLLPVVGYTAILVSRALRALAGLPVEIGPTPQALLR